MTSHPLEILGLSPAAVRIMRYFLVRPAVRVHLRGLQRTLGLGGASVQRVLARLVQLGAIERSEGGRRPVYKAVEDAPLWRALRTLEASVPDPAPLITHALEDVPGVQAAFLFGSTAVGEQRAESDIDILVVEDGEVDRRKLLSQLAEVELILGREVNSVRYTLQALGDRLGDPQHPAQHFVHQVLSGPKKWVAGNINSVAPLAAAAGLQLERLVEAPT